MLEIFNKKFENIFKMGIILIIICITLSVVSLQEILFFPDWIFFLIFMIGIFGLFLCIIAGIIGWRQYYLGEELDERQKKIMGRAAFYSMFITIIFSIITINLLNYYYEELSIKQLITLPILILILSYMIIFYILRKKGDIK